VGLEAEKGTGRGMALERREMRSSQERTVSEKRQPFQRGGCILNVQRGGQYVRIGRIVF